MLIYKALLNGYLYTIFVSYKYSHAIYNVINRQAIFICNIIATLTCSTLYINIMKKFFNKNR